jgi:hypothetical protein
VFDDRSDLLAVDEFGDGCAAVADEPRDLLDRHAADRQQATTRSRPGSRAGSFDHGLVIRFRAAGRPDVAGCPTVVGHPQQPVVVFQHGEQGAASQVRSC